MLKDFVFYNNQAGDGKDMEQMGRLTSDGVWTGNQLLEFGVRRSIRTHKLDLHDLEDRKLFLYIHSGSYEFAVEEDPIVNNEEDIKQ